MRSVSLLQLRFSAAASSSKISGFWFLREATHDFGSPASPCDKKTGAWRRTSATHLLRSAPVSFAGDDDYQRPGQVLLGVGELTLWRRPLKGRALLALGLLELLTCEQQASHRIWSEEVSESSVRVPEGQEVAYQHVRCGDGLA